MPDEVINVLTRSGIEYFESGKKHGTVTAKIDNFKFEITTLREDLLLTEDMRRLNLQRI